VSFAILAAALGALFGGIIADKMGRKPAIIFSDMLLIVGPAILWGASTIKYLFIGRLITGLGVGLSIMASNVFLAESSPINVRGAVVATYQIMIAVGIVASYAAGLIINSWNWMLGLSLIPALI